MPISIELGIFIYFTCEETVEPVEVISYLNIRGKISKFLSWVWHILITKLYILLERENVKEKLEFSKTYG